VQIPPAGLIEASVDELNTVGLGEREWRELKELSASNARVKLLSDQSLRWHQAGPDSAALPPYLPADLDDFGRGYILGLETARILLSTMPAAVKAGVQI
jgi:hypothetical protein